MLCSNCKKNPATIFINEPTKEDKNHLVGYCYNCAKEKGISVDKSDINNINNINPIDIDKMASQFGVIFKDISNSLNNENLDISDENGMPIGSIFGAMFNPNETASNNENSSAANGNKRVKVDKKPKEKKRKFLDTYGTNLTNKAKNNQLDIVIGRDKEINRVIQILNRRTKNNPCLIGEPGVGKTAIAQGLALKIATQNVPAKLLNKEVYLLDMTAVVAGTQFRGQFESRMKAIIDECKSCGNIILVIDEIHNIIGAGDSENSMSAANILKPSLANGEIQLIGTTTLKEYRKYIEKDSALERRFQSVLVEEPNIEDSISILEGIKKYYEDYHKIMEELGQEYYLPIEFSDMGEMKENLEVAREKLKVAEQKAKLFKMLGKEAYICYAYDEELRALGYEVMSDTDRIKEIKKELGMHVSNGFEIPAYNAPDNKSALQIYDIDENCELQVIVHPDGSTTMATFMKGNDADHTIASQKKYCRKSKVLARRLRENWFIISDLQETESPSKVKHSSIGIRQDIGIRTNERTEVRNERTMSR